MLDDSACRYGLCELQIDARGCKSEALSLECMAQLFGSEGVKFRYLTILINGVNAGMHLR